jgi:hypothetical protein
MADATNEDVFYANGINSATGTYGLAPLPWGIYLSSYN